MKYEHQRQLNIMLFKLADLVKYKLLDLLSKWLISMEVMKKEYLFSVTKRLKLIVYQEILEFKTNLFMEMLRKLEDNTLIEILRPDY